MFVGPIIRPFWGESAFKDVLKRKIEVKVVIFWAKTGAD